MRNAQPSSGQPQSGPRSGTLRQNGRRPKPRLTGWPRNVRWSTLATKRRQFSTRPRRMHAWRCSAKSRRSSRGYDLLPDHVESARRIAFLLTRAERRLGIKPPQNFPLAARLDAVLEGAMDTLALDTPT